MVCRSRFLQAPTDRNVICPSAVHDSEDGGTIFIDGFGPSESDQDFMISICPGLKRFFQVCIRCFKHAVFVGPHYK
jgi:hypothetical protein